MSTQREGGLLIWLGLGCVVPTTLFYLYSQGALVITPLSLLGVVLLSIGLAKRERSSPNEPIPPRRSEADHMGPPQPLPPPPPPAADGGLLHNKQGPRGDRP